MFEKRLHALTRAAGTVFLILIFLHIFNFTWLVLFSTGMFKFIPLMNIFETSDMVDYFLKMKIVVTVFGALYLILWIWQRKLKSFEAH